ncbi:hypothetical protein B5E65_04060 [Gemmiger sp. An120]|nr:hypothetical protein B5E65_04060 [Gemmiger sp. An120]
MAPVHPPTAAGPGQPAAAAAHRSRAAADQASGRACGSGTHRWHWVHRERCKAQPPAGTPAPGSRGRLPAAGCTAGRPPPGQSGRGSETRPSPPTALAARQALWGIFAFRGDAFPAEK